MQYEDEPTQVIETDHGGSLAARAQARRQAILNRKTVRLEVPGYENILEVEYRGLTYAEGKRIISRHERQADDAIRDIYVAADQLMLASVNSYELVDGDRTELGMPWGKELARSLGVKVDDAMTARQAMIAAFATDLHLTRHWADYVEWLGSAQDEADEEQRADFSRSR